MNWTKSVSFLHFFCTRPDAQFILHDYRVWLYRAVSWDGISTVSQELQNLGLFVETLKKLLPSGQPVSLDVFATQVSLV